MSLFYIELYRPSGDSLSIPTEDYQTIARATALPIYPEPDGESVTDERSKTVADALSGNLPRSWSVEMARDFLAFLRRGAFRVTAVAY